MYVTLLPDRFAVSEKNKSVHRLSISLQGGSLSSEHKRVVDYRERQNTHSDKALAALSIHIEATATATWGQQAYV